MESLHRALLLGDLVHVQGEELSHVLVRVVDDRLIIELRKVNLDAEGGAVALPHLNFFDLGVFTEGIFEELDFVEIARDQRQFFDSVNATKLSDLGIVNADLFPKLRLLVHHQQVHFTEICGLLKLNRKARHVALNYEESGELLVPEGQIVPEKCDVAEVVCLITHSQQAVIVQVAWQEGLPWHIHYIVLHVELEVGLLVERGRALLGLPLIYDLDGVLARLKVHPDCLRRFVPVHLEDSLVILVIVIVLVSGVGLDMLIRKEVISLRQVQLHHLVIVGTVEDFEEEAHFETDLEVVTRQHFKISVRLRRQNEGAFSVGVVHRHRLYIVHPLEDLL